MSASIQGDFDGRCERPFDLTVLVQNDRVPEGMFEHEHESKSRLADYRPKDVERMSQRLVDASFANFDGRDVAVAGGQQNDAQHLLVESLISAQFRYIDSGLSSCSERACSVSAMTDMLNAATTDSA